MLNAENILTEIVASITTEKLVYPLTTILAAYITKLIKGNNTLSQSDVNKIIEAINEAKIEINESKLEIIDAIQSLIVVINNSQTNQQQPQHQKQQTTQLSVRQNVITLLDENLLYKKGFAKRESSMGYTAYKQKGKNVIEVHGKTSHNNRSYVYFKMYPTNTIGNIIHIPKHLTDISCSKDKEIYGIPLLTRNSRKDLSDLRTMLNNSINTHGF